MRRHGKKDDNHREIVRILKQCGFSVIDTSPLGDDVPDLVVARAGKTGVVEIKSSKGKLTIGQANFKAIWPGLYVVAKTAEDVLKEWYK